MRNFNETFRKDVPYDNVKSHKKLGFHPLFRRYIFQKTTVEGQLTPPAILGLNCHQYFNFLSYLKYAEHVLNILLFIANARAKNIAHLKVSVESTTQ